MCRLFRASRQSVYQSERRQARRGERLSEVGVLVRELRRTMPRLGTRKLYHLLKGELEKRGLKLGRDALFDYLRGEKLLVQPKKNYTRTTNSKHWLKKHPNLLAGKQSSRAEEFFVSDITYLKTKDKTWYLSLVTDAYSRKIMGYHISGDLSAESAAQALKMAVKQRLTNKELIHHSDRGLQYASRVYQTEFRPRTAICFESVSDRVSQTSNQGFDDRRLRLLPECLG